MNAKQLIAAAAIALTGAVAFAQEITPDNLLQPASVKSRDQVNVELLAARKDGTIKSWSNGYIEPLKSTKSRAQVQAELANSPLACAFASSA